MASDMLLPIILSELVDSDDERPRRGKTREWIRRRSQLGLYETLIKELIIEDRLSFKEMFRMSVEDFAFFFLGSSSTGCLFVWFSTENDVSSSLSIFVLNQTVFRVYLKNFRMIWIRSIDVIRSKCWMKEWANQSNTKITLEESEKVGRKVWSRSNFHPTQNFFIQRDFQFFRKFCDRRNRSNISSNMGKMLCWMKCWTGLPRPLLIYLTLLKVCNSFFSILIAYLPTLYSFL